MESEWFEKQNTLKYSLGLYPDPKVENDKTTQASLMKNLRDGLCLICYDDIS